MLVVLACLDASRYDGVKLFDGTDVRVVGVELPKHDLDIPGDAVESHVEFVKDVPVDVSSLRGEESFRELVVGVFRDDVEGHHGGRLIEGTFRGGEHLAHDVLFRSREDETRG